jgi:hypothetical protein
MHVSGIFSQTKTLVIKICFLEKITNKKVRRKKIFFFLEKIFSAKTSARLGYFQLQQRLFKKLLFAFLSNKKDQ